MTFNKNTTISSTNLAQGTASNESDLYDQAERATNHYKY